MNSNSGIRIFLDYSTKHLEFFGTIKKEGAKIGYDTYNDRFSPIGENLVTMGSAKGKKIA